MAHRKQNRPAGHRTANNENRFGGVSSQVHSTTPDNMIWLGDIADLQQLDDGRLRRKLWHCDVMLLDADRPGALNFGRRCMRLKRGLHVIAIGDAKAGETETVSKITV